ncbi:conserved hypothetical protein [Vibrio phage 168E36-1]|nr:conserved hypothetical protein [Vibrio phage 168E36-1]
MQSIVLRLVRLLKILLILSVMAGCSTSSTLTWPTNLEIAKTNDGWVCLSPEATIRLAELRAEIESL